MTRNIFKFIKSVIYIHYNEYFIEVKLFIYLNEFFRCAVTTHELHDRQV